jgi:tRNA nucleotidyltransferase (CCA-adding enzyme)
LKLFDYPKKLDILFDKLIKNHASPIIVGGYVRDNILGIDSIDIDIEVYDINSFEVLESLLQEFGSINSVGKSFGVCKLNFNEYKLDFTLPRSDNKISKGHSGFNIKIDSCMTYKKAASRRDFTINTIGYDVKNKQILDPYNGINDLKNKMIKVVDSDKFGEDPLRVLRAMQFCARFELMPDNELIKICSNMCEKNLLQELPQERIYEEFVKLFVKSKKPSLGLKFLKNINCFNFFNELNMSKEDWSFILQATDRSQNDITVSLAVICYKMDISNKKNFITKLTNQKNLLKDINILHNVANFLVYKNEFPKYTYIKNININRLNIFLQALNIKHDAKLLQNLIPKIHGKDLIDIGFKPSKDFSEITQMLYEVQLSILILKDQ